MKRNGQLSVVSGQLAGAVRERPILFSGEMVRAILEGRVNNGTRGFKTQTRRVVKPQPERCNHHEYPEADWRDAPTEFVCFEGDWACRYCGTPLGKCQYGKVGDRLWVKETFTKTTDVKSKYCVAYRADMSARQLLYEDSGNGDACEIGKSTRPLYETEPGLHFWKPSIFMPRWASRILLEITGVRVERLQEISEEDARAEGCHPEFEVNIADFVNNKKWDAAKASTFVLGYKHLWNRINGNDSWEKNPWVWVIEFKMKN